MKKKSKPLPKPEKAVVERDSAYRRAHAKGYDLGWADGQRDQKKIVEQSFEIAALRQKLITVEEDVMRLSSDLTGTNLKNASQQSELIELYNCRDAANAEITRLRGEVDSWHKACDDELAKRRSTEQDFKDADGALSNYRASYAQNSEAIRKILNRWPVRAGRYLNASDHAELMRLTGGLGE